MPQSSVRKERLVREIVEPDPVLRAELERVCRDLVEAEDWVRVLLLGPGAPLCVLQTRPPADAVLVLSPPGDYERIDAALASGADDTMIWPGIDTELALRAKGVARAHALETERADVSALLDLSEALSNTRDIEGSLLLIARRVAEVMRSERCSIILLDDEGEQGIVVADSADETTKNHPIPVGDAYPEIVEVVRTKQPLVIDDVNKAPLFDDVREILRDKPVGHTALFPVRLDGRVQGVIMCRGADVRTEGLSERQLRFGTIVANSTAIAIRNARMYHSIRERTERVLSARIRAERRLRQLEKYQRFFDLSGDGISIVDGRGQILFANRAAQQILGFDAEDLTQIRLRDVADQGSREIVDELIAGFRAGRQRQRVDLPIIRANGEQAVLSLSTASLDPEAEERLEAHLPPERWAEVAAIISMRDVTETRRIQDELRKTKDFLEKLIESSADAIVAADIRGRILIFNPGAEKITGHKAEDVIGKMNVAKLYPQGVAYEIMQRLRSEKYGGVGKYECRLYELVTSDGGRVPIHLAAALIMDSDRAIASVGIFSDLREQIRMEEELASAQRQLEVSERQAAVLELAGTAAHELSQPLTTILGTAELMARRLPEDSHNRKTIDRILVECDRMAEILNKLGRIGRYETKPYLGHTNILDLDAASKNEDKS